MSAFAVSAFTIPLPIYQCHKQVAALKIKNVIETPRGFELHFEDSRFVPLQVSNFWMGQQLSRDHGYCHLVGGYFVWEDGSARWMSAQAFEANYSLAEAPGAVGPATQAARDVV